LPAGSVPAHDALAKALEGTGIEVRLRDWYAK
jgi:hypothetical protein